MKGFFDFLLEHWFLSSILAFLIVIFIQNEFSAGFGNLKGVNSKKLVKLMNSKKVLLVDIRNKEEYAKGSIASSVNIPFADLEKKLSLVTKKAEKIVFVDQRGVEAIQAFRQVAKSLDDYTKFDYLLGGIESWVSVEDLPLVNASNSSSSGPKQKTSRKKSISSGVSKALDDSIITHTEDKGDSAMKNVKVKIYIKTTCPYCVRALELLDKKGLDYEKIIIDGNDALRAEARDLSGRNTVPQVFINGVSIGGCDELHALDAKGELDNLLKG